MPKSPILGGFSTSRAPGASDNQTINLQVEVVETRDGKVPGFLFLASGLDLIKAVGSGPIRGLLPLNDKLYIVSGPEVYSLDVNLNEVLLGTISDQASPVSMVQNTKQLMIVDGVGGYLVPGGFPLTGGTISDGGGLYDVNDEITLRGTTGIQSSFPVIRVSAVADNPVTSLRLPNRGTTYNSAVGVATAPIQPKPGSGSGFLINILSVLGGTIATFSVSAGGTGYAVGDTGIINAGARDAVYQVLTVTAGAVTTLRILNPGTSYAGASNVTTTASPGVPANVGVGLTVTTTASAGPITAFSIASGGHDYPVGAAGLIAGGTANATYLVDAVGPSGVVTAFTVIDGGTIDAQPATFVQKSTTGSGQNFVLASPTFGSFVGLVPITLPFPNPIKADISDGFGVLVFVGRQEWAASDHLDLSTWKALSFGIADQSPDTNVSVAVIHNEVFLLKEGNTEVWDDQGLSPFPFSPLKGVHIEFGIVAPFSEAIADQELIWLSRNKEGQGVFVMAHGYNVVPIGTQALTSAIQKYANIGDCLAYVRQEGEHVYYVATFPEANVTWVYDKTSSALLGFPIWIQLAAFDNGDINRHWGNAFTLWTGARGVDTTTSSYQPESVLIETPVLVASVGNLVGLPSDYFAAVFSVWVDLPDDSTQKGFWFSQQTNDDSPGSGGVQIGIFNDQSSTANHQVVIKLYDNDLNIIVSARYTLASWTNWRWFGISVDTENQFLQVWTNGGSGDSQLTAASITWSSSNPVGNPSTQSWHLQPPTSGP